MKMIFTRVLSMSAALIVSASAFAQTYPTKPIAIYIGVPPGTSLDASMRVVANEMEKKLGQPMVIEFRPGANTTIATKLVVNAPPDGYTLTFGSGLVVHPFFNRNNAIEMLKELAPVVDIMTTPFYLMVNGKLPATNFKELVAYSKTVPGGLRGGTTVEVQDLLQAVMQARVGLMSRVIPYKGSSQSVVAMLSGDVDISIGSILAYLPHLKNEAVRVMFIASPERSPQFPNIPTSAEAGLPNFNLGLDYGLFAPLGTPIAITRRLAAAGEAATRTPSVVEQIRKNGSEPIGSTPEEQQRRLESVIKFWGDAIKETGFKPRE